jgi:cell division protein FtsB
VVPKFNKETVEKGTRQTAGNDRRYLMKIIVGKYPQSTNETWVKQTGGTKPLLNKCFYERLNAYFEYYKVAVTGYGYRSIADQAKLYLAWKLDPAHNNQAAYPGTSWHNAALAFDVNSQGTDPDGTGHFPATMEADYLLPPEKQTMAKWGICLPLWKGSTTYPENWHIQPIESVKQDIPQWFADEDDILNNTYFYRSLSLVTIPGWTGAPVYMEGKDVQRSMRAFGTSENGVCDANWVNHCKEYQAKNGLVADASCGPATWAKINAQLGSASSDWEAKYNECKAQLDAANQTIAAQAAQITVLNTQITALKTTNVQLTALNATLSAANAKLTQDNKILTDENTKLKSDYALLLAKYNSLHVIVVDYNKAKIIFENSAPAKALANIGVV